MGERLKRAIGTTVFVLALAALLLYRPVLRAIGYDIDGTVPVWADFLTPGQFDAFEREVSRYFQGNAVEIRIHDGIVYAEDGGEYRLRTLAQICRKSKMNEWARIIREHLDELRGDDVEEAKPAMRKVP